MNLLNFFKYKKTLTTIIFFTCIWIVLFGIPFPYSFNHDDYQLFKPKISTLKAGERLDFTELNGGRWKTACLFGGYTRPSVTMAKKGKLSVFDSYYQPLKSWGLIRLDEVEEGEAMISYVDRRNGVHFVHFEIAPKTDLYSSLEHAELCTTVERPWVFVT